MYTLIFFIPMYIIKIFTNIVLVSTLLVLTIFFFNSSKKYHVVGTFLDKVL